jgi:hypothetical protein
LHTGRADSLFEKPGVITDEHCVLVTDALDDEVTDVIADPVSVPVSLAQQPLHPDRMHLTSAFSQRPAVLALQRRHQPGNVIQRPAPWLRAGKPRREARV